MYNIMPSRKDRGEISSTPTPKPLFATPPSCRGLLNSTQRQIYAALRVKDGGSSPPAGRASRLRWSSRRGTRRVETTWTLTMVSTRTLHARLDQRFPRQEMSYSPAVDQSREPHCHIGAGRGVRQADGCLLPVWQQDRCLDAADPEPLADQR